MSLFYHTVSRADFALFMTLLSAEFTLLPLDNSHVRFVVYGSVLIYSSLVYLLCSLHSI